MNKIKYLLLFVLLISACLIFATPASVNFRDATGSPLTQTALNLEAVSKLGAPYTATFPTAGNRWRFQWYKDGGDGIISPLNADGTPGGDDIIAVGTQTPGNTTGVVTLSPGSYAVWYPSSATFEAPGGAGNTWQGDRVFVRIFNANTIAQATKSMAFNSLYTITGTTTQLIQPYIPAYAWGPWVEKQVTPLVSGTISSALPVSGVTVACTGQTSVTTTATGTFNFSVPTGSNITITPSKAGYYFTPASLSYTNVTVATSGVNFTMTSLNPNTAINPIPAIDANDVEVNVGELQWHYTPLSGYSLPTGFRVYFPYNTLTPTTVPYVAETSLFSMSIPQLAYHTTYSWKVVPYYTSAKGQVYEGAPLAVKSSSDGSKGDASSVVIWGFTTKNATIIYPGVNASIDVTGNAAVPDFVFSTPPTAPEITYLIVPVSTVPFLVGEEYMTTAYAMNMNASGTTNITIHTPAGRWFVNAYYNGQWNHGDPYPATGPADVFFYNVPFDAKGDIQILLNNGGDPTLPVELSSFTAIYSAGFFVQLTWIVQSETNHLGYNILRSTDEVLANAITINPEFVSTGSASGTQITYNYRDDEVENNTTYNYWLESVDLDGTSYYFGPVNVLVNNGGEPPTPPVIPTRTELLNAYPNPFDVSMSTTLQYNLKVKDAVKLEVYNVKGQVIWSNINSDPKVGLNKVVWNGKDYEGKQVSSGIYFYRMTSGKYTASKKIILVK